MRKKTILAVIIIVLSITMLPIPGFTASNEKMNLIIKEFKDFSGETADWDLESSNWWESAKNWAGTSKVKMPTPGAIAVWNDDIAFVSEILDEEHIILEYYKDDYSSITKKISDLEKDFVGYIYPHKYSDTYEYVDTLEKEGYPPLRIFNLFNFASLDVEGGVQTNGATVILHQPTKSSGQRWFMVQLDDGNYKIVAGNSGKVLDVGKNLFINTYVSSDRQKWSLELNNGAYIIRNKAQPDKVLTYNNEKGIISLEDPKGSSNGNQRWMLTKF